MTRSSAFPPLDPVALAVELMEIDSTSGREAAVIAHAESLLERRGWTTRRIPVTRGRDDLLATFGADPQVVFSTHLDTVPPFIPPRLEPGEGRLHGRGACDAKGIAAAMLCAAERLRDRGVPVAVLLVVGEETTHDGAHAANEALASGALGIAPHALINGEPTESTLAVGTKGAIRFTLRTEGRAAHSAYPHLGRSATADLARLLVELDTLDLPTHPVLGATTINIGHLAGGVADNVIAPWAEARCMARLVGPPDELLALLERWVDGRATITPSITIDPVLLGTVEGFATSVAAFATDIPALDQWGTPYLFGPGSIHVAHTDDEYIDVSELRAAVDAYDELARRVASGGVVELQP